MNPIFIEFRRVGMQPFSVHDGKTQYDVEYCKRDNRLYYDENGSGSPYLERRNNLWWAIKSLRPDIIDTEGKRQPAPVGNRIELSPKYRDENTGEPISIDAWAYLGKTEYCEACQDFFPVDDLCEHINWDDTEGIAIIMRRENGG